MGLGHEKRDVYRLAIGDVAWGYEKADSLTGTQSIPIPIAITIWMRPRPNVSDHRTREPKANEGSVRRRCWERTSKSLSGSNTLRGHHENKTRATARRNDPDIDSDSDLEGEKTFGMGLQRNERATRDRAAETGPSQHARKERD